MSDALRQAVDHYTRTHAGAAGIVATPVPGLFLVRGTAPGGLEHTIASPLVCLVLQGRKQVTLGNRDLSFASGDSMIVPAAMPSVSRISEASIARPYLALALDLDPSVIAELDVAIDGAEQPALEPPAVIDNHLRDAMLRLVRLRIVPLRWRCWARPWCAKSTIGCCSASRVKRFGGSARRTAVSGALRGPWRYCAETTRGRSPLSGWPGKPA